MQARESNTKGTVRMQRTKMADPGAWSAADEWQGKKEGSGEGSTKGRQNNWKEMGCGKMICKARAEREGKAAVCASGLTPQKILKHVEALIKAKKGSLSSTRKMQREANSKISEVNEDVEKPGLSRIHLRRKRTLA